MRAECGWLVLAVVLSSVAFAQSSDSFEVASVKPVPRSSPQRPPKIDRQIFAISGSLYSFIASAYGLRPCMRKESSNCALISGEPAWAKKDRFEIQATLPAGSAAVTRFEFSDGEAPQLDRMLRTLLEDRFKLMAHSENRELPVYVLTATKNGSKLRAVSAPETRKVADGSSFKIHGLDGIESVRLENGNLVSRLAFRYTSMQEFSQILTSLLDRAVVDRTGLTGTFDFTLEYENAPDSPTTTDTSSFGQMVNAGPALFTALQEQLGLKLEPSRASVRILVIDHVEQPSLN